jgi:hypothetical protein
MPQEPARRRAARHPLRKPLASGPGDLREPSPADTAMTVFYDVSADLKTFSENAHGVR